MVRGLYIGCWHVWDEKQYFNDIECFRTTHSMPVITEKK